ALQPLLKAIGDLANSFDKLGVKYSEVIKSGRTHLQDAVPVTIGQEFAAYASTIQHSKDDLSTRSVRLYEVALGGTAVGTGVNAHADFKELVIAELNKLTGLPLKAASNPFEALQSRGAVVSVSGALKELALELIRIANDLRLLS